MNPYERGGSGIGIAIAKHFLDAGSQGHSLLFSATNNAPSQQFQMGLLKLAIIHYR
ncbi:hypothetical protein H6G64_36520 [Calothrix sp. FACHB-156]|nr:hypothetical protein [Calothrix sp. FACHB-156]